MVSDGFSFVRVVFAGFRMVLLWFRVVYISFRWMPLILWTNPTLSLKGCEAAHYLNPEIQNRNAKLRVLQQTYAPSNRCSRGFIPAPEVAR